MNGVIFTMFLSWPVGGEILKFEINQWWHRHGSSALEGFFSQDEMTELEHLWEKGGNHPFLANVGIAM